jgi:hypothetical protein
MKKFVANVLGNSIQNQPKEKVWIWFNAKK